MKGARLLTMASGDTRAKPKPIWFPRVNALNSVGGIPVAGGILLIHRDLRIISTDQYR